MVTLMQYAPKTTLGDAPAMELKARLDPWVYGAGSKVHFTERLSPGAARAPSHPQPGTGVHARHNGRRGRQAVHRRQAGAASIPDAGPDGIQPAIRRPRCEATWVARA